MSTNTNSMAVLQAAVAAWAESQAVLAKAEAASASNQADAAYQAAEERSSATSHAENVAWTAASNHNASGERVAATKAAVQAARASEDDAWGAYYDADSRRTTAQGVLESAQAEEAAAARAVAQAAAALVWEAPCGRKDAHEAGACECHGYHP